MLRLAKLVFALGVASLALSGTPAEARSRFFVGGGFGLGFGDVNFVDLSGVFAYRATERITTGLRLTWRNREDKRFEPDLTTNDYGAAVFGRFYVKRPWFLHAEYERLSYETIQADLETNRTEFDSLLVGGGLMHPLGRNVSLYATGLYNLSYDSSDSRSPYDSPWIVRAGIGFFF